MENVHVIIAELSQLTRLGIISLIKQLGYPVTIREIGSADKLPHILLKDNNGLLVISSSFISHCPPDFNRAVLSKNIGIARILILDQDHFDKTGYKFDEVIMLADTEKIILKKLERQFAHLVEPATGVMLSEDISEREKDVLQLVALGLTNKEIAERLFISSHTVITHRKNITSKLGIKTIAGLTVYAVIHKLISPEALH